MVQKVTSTVLISDEMIVDYGIGTEEEIQEAAMRLLARAHEIADWYRSLPWHVRARIQARAWIRKVLRRG